MPRKILVADDHYLVRRAIKTILECDGKYQVCCEACDGVEAIRLTRQCRHDVVILDLLMPTLNGFNAAKQISKLVPGVRIVLHTLYGNPGIEREAEKYGVHVVVRKVGSRNLKDVVDDLLRDDQSARAA
jgi:DNA-binding NarL/FixJ family response regulator